jgi:WD40 repeat protein
MHAPFYISNTHVKSTEFAPDYDCSFPAEKNRFLSTTLNQISVWDQSNTNEPLYKVQSSTSPLQCASWSPNEPQSMIVYGGYDRNLCIVDTRVDSRRSVVWSVANAHDRPITDAKFNTFIPYWLASAG